MVGVALSMSAQEAIVYAAIIAADHGTPGRFRRDYALALDPVAVSELTACGAWTTAPGGWAIRDRDALTLADRVISRIDTATATTTATGT